MNFLTRTPVRSARSAPRRAAGPGIPPVARSGAASVFLLAALALPAQAIVHDRLPGDDAGGSTSLPVPAVREASVAAPVEAGPSTVVRTVDRTE